MFQIKFVDFDEIYFMSRTIFLHDEQPFRKLIKFCVTSSKEGFMLDLSI